MPIDYTDAPPPSCELIPDPTIAGLSIYIRAGGVGEDGMCKRSANGDCEMLDIEFTLLDGTYKGRKFWNNLLISGTTDGQKKMAQSNIAVLKAILDSVLGLKPDDKSAEARAARTVSLKWFQGRCFIGKIGTEKGGPNKNKPGENYPDKNVLIGVITPDKNEWHSIEQPPPFNGDGADAVAPTPSASAAPVERPGWAQ